MQRLEISKGVAYGCKYTRHETLCKWLRKYEYRKQNSRNKEALFARAQGAIFFDVHNKYWVKWVGNKHRDYMTNGIQSTYHSPTPASYLFFNMQHPLSKFHVPVDPIRLRFNGTHPVPSTLSPKCQVFKLRVLQVNRVLVIQASGIWW